MFVDIEPELLKKAWRYANTRATKGRRDYANAYIGWLRNGAEGNEPMRPRRVTVAEAAGIRFDIDGMRLWEHVRRNDHAIRR